MFIRAHNRESNNSYNNNINNDPSALCCCCCYYYYYHSAAAANGMLSSPLSASANNNNNTAKQQPPPPLSFLPFSSSSPCFCYCYCYSSTSSLGLNLSSSSFTRRRRGWAPGRCVQGWQTPGQPRAQPAHRGSPAAVELLVLLCTCSCLVSQSKEHTTSQTNNHLLCPHRLPPLHHQHPPTQHTAYNTPTPLHYQLLPSPVRAHRS